MTRADHLTWCKREALALLPDEPEKALEFMLAALALHPELALHARQFFAPWMDEQKDTAKVRKWIEGFH